MSDQYELTCHPSVLTAEVSAAVDSIAIRAKRVSPGELRLQYRLTGTLAALHLPVVSASQRRDELWQHTCAEVFVAEQVTTAYCEFNFSPSTAWAAYEFDDYRLGMRPSSCQAPQIHCTLSEQMLELQVQLFLPSHFEHQSPLRLGVTMVVEQLSGYRSYWALAHAGERPDFHRRDGFIVEL